MAISIPIFTSKLEAAREAVDVSNLRSAYALGQVEALTEQPTAVVTKYYDPASGDLVDAASKPAAYGKGTATSTGTTYDLPTVCGTYPTGTATTAQVIQVKYNSSGVTECKFVD